jgi:4-amino-4-deoxychorismate lyase
MLWIDGRPDDTGALVLDEGLLFGRGVFETLRVHEGPLFWNEHLARLNNGLVRLRIRGPIDPDALREQVQSLPIRHCVLKIVATPSNLILQTRPIPPELTRGLRLSIAEGHRTTQPLLLSCKTLSYLDNLLAWEAAQQRGFDDAVLLNDSGRVTETSRSNLFFVRGGRLHTPDLSCGLLPGIVRQWVLDRFPVQQGFYSLEELQSAEAVFATGSVIGIHPVENIDGQMLGTSMLREEIRSAYVEGIS